MCDDALARILPKPQSFSGENNDLHDWKFVFVAWAVALMPEMDSYMTQVTDGSDDELRFDEFIDDAKRLGNHMMGVLIGLTKGKALRVVQGTPRPRNGFEAWRRLVHTHEADALVRRTLMLSSVLSYDFKGPDFRDKLVEWENKLREYELSLPAGETIGEPINIAVVTQGAPVQLRSHL